MQVVQHENEWMLVGDRGQPTGYRVKQQQPGLARVRGRGRRSRPAQGRHDRSQQFRNVGAASRKAALRDQGVKGLRPWPVARGADPRPAGAPHHRWRRRLGLKHPSHQSGLSQTGLTGDQDQLGPSLLRLNQPRPDSVAGRITTDEQRLVRRLLRHGRIVHDLWLAATVGASGEPPDGNLADRARIWRPHW